MEFKSKMGLIYHKSSIHEGKKPHTCKLCNASFTQSCNLKTHISTVHEGKRPFQCSVCGYRFAKKYDLKKHVENVHEGKKPFSCPLCDLSFANARYGNLVVEFSMSSILFLRKEQIQLSKLKFWIANHSFLM